MSADDTRIAELRARVDRLEGELAAIRRELGAAPTPEPRPAPVPPPRPFEIERPKLDLSWLAGARGLALAGGLVTLLGIGFVFALAASRGWIGPAVRCGIGGGVSALLVAAALEIRRRYGAYAASLVAAGTGIGGAYVTLYAASRGYDLLPTPVVFAAVVAVAAVAVALALAWGSQLLAVLGLVTVVVAPPLVEGDLTTVGLVASLVAAGAALWLAQERGWPWLASLAYAPALVQVLVYVADAHHDTFYSSVRGTYVDSPHRGAASALAAATFALALAAGAAFQRRAGSRIGALAAALAGSSVPLALVASWALVDHRRTYLFLAIACAYGVAAVLLLRLGELAEMLAAFALLFVALATANALSNGGLAVAWALEGLTLVALAARFDRRRYQAAAIAYFAASAVHVFAFETPLHHLFSEHEHPASGIVALVVLAAGLAATAWVVRGRTQVVEKLDLAAAGIAALLVLYAVSLGVLELAQQTGSDVHDSFQRGETMVSVLWAVVALSLLGAGLARGVRELRLAGLGLLGLALGKLFLFDLAHLSSLARAGSFLAVGLTLLAGGFLVQRAAAR